MSLGLNPIVVGLKSVSTTAYKCKVIHPLALNDDKGINTLEAVIRTTGAKVVITLEDIWTIANVAPLRDRMGFIWIAYNPVESIPYPDKMLLSRPNKYLDINKVYQSMDYIVAFTEFGQRAISKMCYKPVYQVYLGVDTDFYTPIPKADAKRALGFDERVMLFSMIKSNSMRSGFEHLLEAWQKYLEKCHRMKDNELIALSRLYIHTDVYGNGYPILDMIKSRNLQDSVVTDENLCIGKGYPPTHLRNIYQSTDITVSTTHGEGFGLNIAESMAVGTPCIVPDYAGPAEWGKGGLVTVPIASYFMPEFSDTNWAIVDTKKMADEMYRLAKNPQKRLDIGKKARSVVEQYTWSEFEKQFAYIINEAVEQSENIELSNIRFEYV
jgi:glycosyltransferase involved in cell wall biosynthesis